MHDENRGAINAYVGYEFQIEVTVWLALSLMLRQRVCTSLFVEPASGEDAEATMPTDADEASATLDVSPSALVPVEVQIKLRRSGHWTPGAFANVLSTRGKGAQGPSPRARAVERLVADPHRHYALITNAQVHSDLQQFVIGELGRLSSAAGLPAGITVPDPVSIARRIGIVPEKSPELLKLEIAKLLVHVAHLPRTKVVNVKRDVKRDVAKYDTFCYPPDRYAPPSPPRCPGHPPPCDGARTRTPGHLPG